MEAVLLQNKEKEFIILFILERSKVRNKAINTKINNLQ